MLTQRARHSRSGHPAHGASVPWGQGDSPIKAVLQLLKRERGDSG
jgi:hypothetical protein